MIKSKQLWISLVMTFIILTGLSFKMMDTIISKPKLKYLVRQPKVPIEKPPLIILLHGVGSSEEKMFSFSALPDQFLVISARGPITLRENSYAWFQVQITPEKSIINEQQAEGSRKEILQFIEDLKNVEEFDENQVYLMGFSQGGIMSYSVALTEPEKIKGIAVMSGRLLPEVKPLIVSNERLKKLKIFISHGTQDSVLRYQYAVDALEYLKSKELNPDFNQYNEDHAINQQMMGDVIKWLEIN